MEDAIYKAAKAAYGEAAAKFIDGGRSDAIRKAKAHLEKLKKNST